MTDIIDFDDLLEDEKIQKEFEASALNDDMAGEFDKFGKLTIQMTRFKKWHEKIPTDISFQEWRELPPSQTSFEYQFTIDTQEFDERAREGGWSHERKLGARSKDWYQIFEPSMEVIFGEKCLKGAARNQTLAKINNKYVWAKDVPQAPDKKGNIPSNPNTGKPYMTIKMVKVFDDQSECRTAYEKRFGSTSSFPSNASASSDAPALPRIWAAMPESLQSEYQRYINAENKTGHEVAIILNIIDKDGNPGIDKNGNKIDPDAILRWLADTPF